jgi:hypothetical protein
MHAILNEQGNFRVAGRLVLALISHADYKNGINEEIFGITGSV